MTKTISLTFLLLSATAALAQSLPLDPALQRAQADAQVNQTLQQTQQNNANLQFQLQQNEIRQQQLFNTMPPPAYQQPAWQPPQISTPQPIK
ncbi:MAG TPA: hypothetical protein VNW15_12230 [Rhizomicrobium sp.]|nr:hypothetical protein [Rhizomicrobium sp.]